MALSMFVSYSTRIILNALGVSDLEYLPLSVEQLEFSFLTVLYQGAIFDLSIMPKEPASKVH